MYHTPIIPMVLAMQLLFSCPLSLTLDEVNGSLNMIALLECQPSESPARVSIVSEKVFGNPVYKGNAETRLWF